MVASGKKNNNNNNNNGFDSFLYVAFGSCGGVIETAAAILRTGNKKVSKDRDGAPYFGGMIKRSNEVTEVPEFLTTGILQDCGLEDDNTMTHDDISAISAATLEEMARGTKPANRTNQIRHYYLDDAAARRSGTDSLKSSLRVRGSWNVSLSDSSTDATSVSESEDDDNDNDMPPANTTRRFVFDDKQESSKSGSSETTFVSTSVDSSSEFRRQRRRSSQRKYIPVR